MKHNLPEVCLELYDARSRRSPVEIRDSVGLTIRLFSNQWPFAIPDGATAEIMLNGGNGVPLEVVDREKGELYFVKPLEGDAVVAVRYGAFEMSWQGFRIRKVRDDLS